jgi:hypothetical protein
MKNRDQVSGVKLRAGPDLCKILRLGTGDKFASGATGTGPRDSRGERNPML